MGERGGPGPDRRGETRGQRIAEEERREERRVERGQAREKTRGKPREALENRYAELETINLSATSDLGLQNG